MLKVFQGFFTDQPAHFTDSGGENHGVEATKYGTVGANIFFQPIAFDFKRQLTAFIPGFSRCNDIAAVGKFTGNTENPRFFVEGAVDFFRRKPFAIHDEGRNRRIDVAAARPHGGTFKRGQPHRGVDRDAIFDGGMGDPVADVHGDEVALFDSFSQQDCRTLGNIEVAGAVETVPPHTMFFVPLVRYRVHVGMFRHTLMKSGVENGDVRHVGQVGLSRFDPGNVRRIVQRGQMLDILDGIKDGVIDQD